MLQQREDQVHNQHQKADPSSGENRKSRRGFASMDKERHKLVSSKGGQSPRVTHTQSNQQANNTQSYQGL